MSDEPFNLMRSMTATVLQWVFQALLLGLLYTIWRIRTNDKAGMLLILVMPLIFAAAYFKGSARAASTPR